MLIKILRSVFTDKSSIGSLCINDEFFCYTLEDVVREEGIKISGMTAIPAGKYRLVIDQSVRFRRAMPHLLDVPNFEGIRIHAGNKACDTEGCILLGFTKDVDFVGQSVAAFNKFFDLLYLALRDEECWIEIINEEKEV